jgi:hypothetical protein
MAIVHPDSEIGDCFQPTTGRACAQTLPLAASALARRTGAGVDAKTAIALSRFLNVIAPGHAALVEAVGQFRPSGFHIDNTYWPPSTAEDTASVPGVNIDGDVLTAGTLERIIILAATQLAHAARGPALRVATFPELTEARLNTLDDFEALTLPTRSPLDFPTLAAWAPPNASQAFLEELQFILTVPPPPTADEVAGWLTDARSLLQVMA